MVVQFKVTLTHCYELKGQKQNTKSETAIRQGCPTTSPTAPNTLHVGPNLAELPKDEVIEKVTENLRALRQKL